MLAAARDALDGLDAGLLQNREPPVGERVQLIARSLQDPLPAGPFELVASALCVHHLTGAEKADLFARIRPALAPGGRLVLADVVVPEDPADARTSLTPGFDKPSTVAEQLAWLAAAGFDAHLVWSRMDLALIVASLPG